MENNGDEIAVLFPEGPNHGEFRSSYELRFACR